LTCWLYYCYFGLFTIHSYFSNNISTFYFANWDGGCVRENKRQDNILLFKTVTLCILSSPIFLSNHSSS